jgi:hypothetical protein
MGVKSGTIGNILGNRLGTRGMCWECIENLMGTHWEQQKSNTSALRPPPKRKKDLGLLGGIHDSVGFTVTYLANI